MAQHTKVCVFAYLQYFATSYELREVLEYFALTGLVTATGIMLYSIIST